MIRAVLIAALLLASSAAANSGVFAARLTPCIGHNVGGIANIANLCSATAFVESGGVGVFAQIRPVDGPALHNWVLYPYVVTQQLRVGELLDVRALPGAQIGMRHGEFFIGIAADVLISVQW